MYRRLLKPIVNLLGILFLVSSPPTPLVAAEHIGLDLASIGKTYERSVQPGNVMVELESALPNADYWVEELRIEKERWDPLPLPTRSPLVQAKAVPDGECSDHAADLTSALLAATEERQLSKIGKKAVEDSPQCKSDLEAVYARLTTKQMANERLRRGERMFLKLCRTAAEAVCWKVTLSTGPTGEWNLLYGFTFVPDLNRRYYLSETKETSSEINEQGTTVSTEVSSFQIRREEDPSSEDFDPLPSILYSFTPASEVGEMNQWSWVFGLGYDLSEPAGFFGVSWTHGRNAMVTLGVAIHKQTRLHGRFQEDQILEQSLGEEMLLKSTYRPNAFIGLAFRFDSNPFASTNADTRDDDEEES